MVNTTTEAAAETELTAFDRELIRQLRDYCCDTLAGRCPGGDSPPILTALVEMVKTPDCHAIPVPPADRARAIAACVVSYHNPLPEPAIEQQPELEAAEAVSESQEVQRVGDHRTVTVGDGERCAAGHYGNATAGDRGMAVALEFGTATVGDCGVASAGDFGRAVAGDYGLAESGFRGQSQAGVGGIVLAGERGVLQLAYRCPDQQRTRKRTVHIGEDGTKPGVKYQLSESGEFVPLAGDA